MATRLWLTAYAEPASIVVQEDFETCAEAMMPTESVTSSLQSRMKMTFHRLNGDRVLIHPQLIGYVEENVEDD